MITRISDNLAELLDTELSKQALEGEDIHWDCTVLPGDEKAPFAFLTVAMSGAVLGTKVQLGIFVPNPAFISEKECSEIVTTLMEILRQQRTQQLQPKGGLVLPGAP